MTVGANIIGKLTENFSPCRGYLVCFCRLTTTGSLISCCWGPNCGLCRMCRATGLAQLLKALISLHLSGACWRILSVQFGTVIVLFIVDKIRQIGRKIDHPSVPVEWIIDNYLLWVGITMRNERGGNLHKCAFYESLIDNYCPIIEIEIMAIVIKLIYRYVNIREVPPRLVCKWMDLWELSVTSG